MNIRVAGEVRIATALLHRRYPEREDFTVREIVRQAEAGEPHRRSPGVQVHAYLHCVANKAPNPGRYAFGNGDGPTLGRATRATADAFQARMRLAQTGARQPTGS